ncbi:phospholipase ABHD3-like [Corticium candelabrum]|uniref:phospholipase ABHD3-like n=1 Tax=Corticium candelabrum TaxID=121492 RepID=UPI002E2733BC|nr:phospholipase ABHD3-like [Corticium candelabrum]
MTAMITRSDLLTAFANSMIFIYQHKLLSSVVFISLSIYFTYHLVFSASTLFHVALMSGICLYLAYYWMFHVQKPDIYCQEAFRRFLECHCPTAFSVYYPTVWTVGGHVRSFSRGFIQRRLPVQYERETVKLADGGTLCLDWTKPSKQQTNGSTKIVLFMAGLTGGSKENYTTRICHKANELGYTAVVMNNRGCADTPLTTPMTYCATVTADLQAVLSVIHKRYPNCPVFIVGISLGGVLATQYLCKSGESGNDAGVVGVLSVSAPFDCMTTSLQLELPLSLVTFNYFLTSQLVRNLHQNIDIFKKADGLTFDIDAVVQVKTLAEFDEKLVVPMFGYNDRFEYYMDASTSERLKHISVPYLAMNAGDDPFAPHFALPTQQFTSSQYTALLTTTAGGHIGFADSIWPSGPTLVDKIFAEFSTACFEHGNELKAVN